MNRSKLDQMYAQKDHTDRANRGVPLSAWLLVGAFSIAGWSIALLLGWMLKYFLGW